MLRPRVKLVALPLLELRTAELLQVRLNFVGKNLGRVVLNAMLIPLFYQFNRTGICICIRDDEGTFVLAKGIPVTHVYLIPMGGALGLFYALEWLGNMGFDNDDFSLDSKITTDAFNSRRVDITKFGQVLSACRQLFDTKFTNSKVEFIRRQTNEVTHHLAGVAALLTSLTIYTNVPRCIEQIIDNEML